MFSDHRLLRVVGLSSVVSGCGSLRKKRASHCPDTLTGPSISIRPHWRARSARLPPRRSPLLRDRRNGPLVRQIAAQLVRMGNWTASFGGIGSTASPRLIPDAPFKRNDPILHGWMDGFILWLGAGQQSVARHRTRVRDCDMTGRVMNHFCRKSIRLHSIRFS